MASSTMPPSEYRSDIVEDQGVGLVGTRARTCGPFEPRSRSSSWTRGCRAQVQRPRIVGVELEVLLS